MENKNLLEKLLNKAEIYDENMYFRKELFENNMVLAEENGSGLITNLENNFMITGKVSKLKEFCFNHNKEIGYLLMKENKNNFFFHLNANDNDVSVGFKVSEIFKKDKELDGKLPETNFRFQVPMEWLSNVCDLENESNFIYEKLWVDELTIDDYKSLNTSETLYNTVIRILEGKLLRINLLGK